VQGTGRDRRGLVAYPVDAMSATINWDAIRAARVAGLSFGEIARVYGVKLNTIRVRAKRERWAQTLAPVRQSMVTAVSQATERAAEMQAAKVADETRDLLQKDCLHTARRLETYHPGSVREESIREKFAESLTRRASAVFGWDRKAADGINQSITVNVACMASLPDADPVPVQAFTPEAMAIDAEPASGG
jgi:hypothetical protein